ncbi:hypothetical protein [Mesorhizobium sp. CN2-181]|uniref:hypothetical protein n=1 Tax=Mesorhizobium yinganensis TaxID=3157707 RepID=UPI0032B7E7DD
MTNELDILRLSHLIRRLVCETGIEERDARDLVATLGVDWSSLVREARILQKAAVA